ncbi:MAG: hypothetical protein H8E64_06490 [Candidatus Marinimicrobia bacterium]|nr:hypothetical protein [Candidatus Neomarinimicrobiota bacterium]
MQDLTLVIKLERSYEDFDTFETSIQAQVRVELKNSYQPTYQIWTSN